HRRAPPLLPLLGHGELELGGVGVAQQADDLLQLDVGEPWCCLFGVGHLGVLSSTGRAVAACTERISPNALFGAADDALVAGAVLTLNGVGAYAQPATSAPPS